ncbi:unnamed protein product [Lupinus luteus]|uniref:Transposase MuDR plant domain-containing protein n=1 Tax=Lupinus luteus TaxID=3873 RepID=A0AAV1WWA7_LUPLU
MIFPNLEVFKEVIKDYGVYKGKYNLIFSKRDKLRCRVTCKGDCSCNLTELRPSKILIVVKNGLGRRLEYCVRKNLHVHGEDAKFCFVPHPLAIFTLIQRVQIY